MRIPHKRQKISFLPGRSQVRSIWNFFPPRFSRREISHAVCHLQNPKSAALIFESGRIVITGLRKPEEIPVPLQNLLNKLKEVGITCPGKPKVPITTIVCSWDLGYPLNLARIMVSLMDHERVEYEPEVFHGLVCRISDPKIVFLLFFSGKIFITGGKNREGVKAGQALLQEKLSVVT